MKVKTKLLCGLTLSIATIAPQLTKAQSTSTTTVTTTSAPMVTNQTTTIVTTAPGTTAGSNDSRNYVMNPDYYPARRRKQLEAYNNHEYRFAPKPRNMWEVGVGAGLQDVFGDVAPNVIGQNFSYGFNASVRKSWSYMFSTRIQYIYGLSTGMGYQLVSPNVNRSFVGYDGPIVPNYRMESHELNLDLMLNLGNISFSRAHNGVSFYGFLGIGALAFQTRVNQLDANGQQYNFGAIVGNTPQTEANKSTIRKKLNSAMDNSYETLAETQPDKTKLGNKTLDWTPSVGVGAQFRLSSRINLQIEDRLSVPGGEDLLDGTRFANSNTPQLTVNNDLLNYASIGINFNLGNKHKNAEPLYWVNPLNFDRPVVATTTTNVFSPSAMDFTIRTPRLIPMNDKINVSFPVRNSVFFDEGSTAIPSRYVLLSKDQAGGFTEDKLSANPTMYGNQTDNQLALYYNVLNIVGDRMRANPNSTITLKHATGKHDEGEGKEMAQHVKDYLVDRFGIAESRIIVDGETWTREPEKNSSNEQLATLRADNRRVDIVSSSHELLTEVEAGETPTLRPVSMTAKQQDPLDSFVIFSVDGSLKYLNSWTVTVTDENGSVQHFGPYMQETVALPVSTILGGRTQGNFRIVMDGQAKDGRSMTKESVLNLVNLADPNERGARYSILFDFDKSQTVATYHKFLTDVVAPQIHDNDIVFIHGHTDNIGSKQYNMMLSQERAMTVQKTLQDAISKNNVQGVSFETYGFGEEATTAPYANNLPEDHFYNRTVIIDIVSTGNTGK